MVESVRENSNIENAVMVETFASKGLCITSDDRGTMNTPKTKRRRRKRRVKKRMRKQIHSTMIPIIWKVTLSFLQKQMTFALGAALTILQSIYKLQPLQVIYMHAVFLNDKWMTTILFHIQQLRNRHDHVLSEMMTFFMKQIVDDDKQPQHQQQQKCALQQQSEIKERARFEKWHYVFDLFDYYCEVDFTG